MMFVETLRGTKFGLEIYEFFIITFFKKLNFMLSLIKRKYTNLISDQRFSEILTGSAWALSGRVVSTVLGLAFSVLVARLYGAEVVGIVAVINSFLMLVTIFTVIGIDTSILRLIPEHLAKYSPTSAFKVYRKTQWMVVGISLITAALFFFSSHIIADKVFSKPHLSYYFALASVFVIFRSMMKLNTQAVRGLRLIKLFALMQFLPQASNLLFLIAAGMLWPSKEIPVYAVLFGFATTGIIGWFIMELTFKSRMKPTDIVKSIHKRTILSLSLPMLMSTSMMFLMGQTSVLMLSIFRTETEVGYYSIAVKLATLAAFVLQAVNSLAAPKFSEFFQTNKIDDLFYVAKKSAKLIFLITSPILLILLVFGKHILSIIYGPEFLVAYPALAVLVGGQFVKSMLGSTEIFMNMTGHEKALRNILILSTVFNVSLNFLFVQKFGIIGAALATMLSIVFWNIGLLIYTKVIFRKTLAYFPFIV